jgi:hypothetical protein
MNGAGKSWDALRDAAAGCKGWSWPDRMRDENGTHYFGQRRDGEFNEIGTIDASTYTGEYVDDIRVLKFIRTAQPETILKLLDALASSQRRSLELERVYNERGLQIERLDVALARRAPSLTNVIHWLEGSCEPRQAADELRAYLQMMEQPEAPALASETPP